MPPERVETPMDEAPPDLRARRRGIPLVLLRVIFIAALAATLATRSLTKVVMPQPGLPTSAVW